MMESHSHEHRADEEPGLSQPEAKSGDGGSRTVADQSPAEPERHRTRDQTAVDGTLARDRIPGREARSSATEDQRITRCRHQQGTRHDKGKRRVPATVRHRGEIEKRENDGGVDHPREAEAGTEEKPEIKAAIRRIGLAPEHMTGDKDDGGADSHEGQRRRQRSSRQAS